jgi:hypothetical protein
MRINFNYSLVIILFATLFSSGGTVVAKEFSFAQKAVERESARKYIVNLKHTMLKSLPFHAKATIIRTTENENEFIVENIAHENKVWKGRFNAKNIESTWSIRQKLFLGQFHLSIGFKFKRPVTLVSMEPGDKSRSQTKTITMGTGPTFNNGLSTFLNFYNISMRTQTIELVLATVPDSVETQERLDSVKVDNTKLFIAFAEESNRTYFIQQLRLARLDGRKGDNIVRDPMKLGRYKIFSSNCITSVVRNVSMALYPEYQQMVLDHEPLKKNIRSFESVLSQSELVERIKIFEKGASELDRSLQNQVKAKNLNLENPADVSAKSNFVRLSQDLAVDYANTFGRDNKIIMPKKSNDFMDLVEVKK